MRKTILATLAGMFAIFGLVAVPTESAVAAGSVTLYEKAQFDMTGAASQILEAQIPTACSAIPPNLTTVRSVQNQTSGPGTSVSFYTASSCALASLVATVAPGASNPDINSPTGAGFWQRTP
jgi:hypothetical protein